MAAFDHGVFAFADVQHNVWPVILVTNPKNVLFNNVKDINAARRSTHIRYNILLVGRKFEFFLYSICTCRIMVFSPSPIQSVMVKVDDGNWYPAKNIEGGPLFVLEWNPVQYLEGIHEMTVFNKVSKCHKWHNRVRF